MTSVPTCSRTWQAEAAEDRRLSEADRASFERHIVTCAVCERAVRELVCLRNIGANVTESSPLEHRRARNELLRRANELTLGAARGFPWRGLAVAFALLALAVGVGVGLRARAPVESVVAEPSYEMTASTGAEWSAVERGSTLRLAVKRGHFLLSVHHLEPRQRFILVLPDGELEVQGTRFAVDVDGAQTLGVAVEEGRVALRLLGPDRAPMLLRAGDRFAAAAPNVAPSVAPSAASAPAEQASPPAPPPREQPSSAGSEPPLREALARASDGARPAPGAVDARGVEFTQAMAAFSAGNYGEAERRLLAFAARYPSDLRAEDATFLGAVASSRRGDNEGARTLARTYLGRYPNGLRRLEAERLAR